MINCNFFRLLPFLIILSSCGSNKDSKIDLAQQNTPPYAQNIEIFDTNFGLLNKNDELIGLYLYTDNDNDLEGKSKFSWFRDDDKTILEDTINYIVTANDRGSIIKFEVEPKSTTGLQNYKKFTSSVNIPKIEANYRWEKININEGAETEAIIGFDGPFGLSVYNNKIFVSDIFDHKIITFSSNYKFDQWLGYSEEFEEMIWSEDVGHEGRNEFEIPPDGYLNGPHSVAVTIEGLIYISDFFGKNVLVFNNNGLFSHYLKLPDNLDLLFEGPANVYIDINGYIYVSDWYGNRIFVFDKYENFEGWIGESTTSNDNIKKSGKAIKSENLGGFFKPHMVVVDDSGKLYVVDQGNNRVQRFSSEYEPLGFIGYSDSGEVNWKNSVPAIATNKIGGFNQPVSISILNRESLIISDWSNHRIVKYSLDGNFEGWIGGSESNPVLYWNEMEPEDEINYDNAFFRAPYDAKIHEGKLLIADGHKKLVFIIKL